MMTMEVPLKEAKEMEEEKTSSAGDEKSEISEVITESTSAEMEQEEVPETLQVQEKVPETLQVQEKVPETLQVQEKVPETLQVQEKVPETIQEQEQVPETIQEQEQAPPPQTAEDQCEAPHAVNEKQENVLNLNNEVVKMRKEVKRLRALIVRKLTRQIGALKKKKGKDADIERNQRRAARLLEEIHAIKNLVPDVVTKTALQKNLNFEQVCKDPKSTISDRAITRIATHPQFNKKIEGIKAAVKAFKEERLNEGKPGKRMQAKADKPKKQPPTTNPQKASDVVVDKTVTPSKSKNSEKDVVEACHNRPCHSFHAEKVEPKVQQTETRTRNTNKKQSLVKNDVRSKPVNKSDENKNTSTKIEVPPKPNIEAESDLELSESDEKEYFDDSTEERFHKQSSGESEESDNDFFVGKVNKFKKKKTKTVEDKKVQKAIEDSSNKHQTNKVQSKLDELESRLKAKATSVNSVFCPSLAGPKTGKRAGKGDQKFGGLDKRKDGLSGNKDFSKQNKFQNKSIGKPEHSGLKHSNLCPREKTFGKEHKQFGGRGQAKEHTRPKDTRGGSMFTHQTPQQKLHPSWEASKKRKEQQGQILAFQGKKIKFDDDD